MILYMRKVTSILFVLSLFIVTSTKAQLADWPKMKDLKMKEIRTASNNILVAYYLGPDINAVATNPSDWSLNGKVPLNIDKWVTPNWSQVEFGFEHHIYLTMNEPLVQGQKYTLKTPQGDTTFVFDPKKIFCESIKTNQSGYSALSKVRYANFAIWTGTGGGKTIEGKLPAYEVSEIQSGKLITKGNLTELGKSENSGDFVYRIDLSQVPEGGPYQIEVKGYGSSFPFAVGGEYAKRLAYVSFRGLLYERCGIEQKKPYFDHDIREICHTTVHVTNSPYREAKVDLSASDPIIKTHGGYHDAGDADRRDHHSIAPMALLTYYEMFPNYFSDKQYNIPDMFDADYRPIGQGNGIPDIIDEAEWGTAIYECIQEKNGGVHAGTECNGYPGDSVGLDKDVKPYATLMVRNNSTALAAGLFAHMARAIKPFNKERAAELQERAERAWIFTGDSAAMPYHLYYLVQYYLLTGNQNIHRKLIELAPKVAAYETTHQDNPRSLPEGKLILGAHFFSYLLQNEQPKDPGVVKLFENIIRKVADRRIAELNANLWPNGTSEPSRWWGSQTAQGQYADPLLMMWRLTGEQKYIDAASQLMDYNMGLNPIGKCYLSGTGFDRVEDPLHHDSYPMKLKGWGPAPGLMVFGPSNSRQFQKEGCPTMIPDLSAVPAQRKWLDNRRNVSGCEFTVPESLAYPSAIYTILSGGGTWDRNTTMYKK
jgi:endoglucanase